jgi:hypothetical protein
MTGCIFFMGTAITRGITERYTNPDGVIYGAGQFFGTPLYAAVMENVTIIGTPSMREWKDGGVVFFILSLPLDFAFDTVLLPIDLIAWSAGYSKINYPRKQKIIDQNIRITTPDGASSVGETPNH